MQESLLEPEAVYELVGDRVVEAGARRWVAAMRHLGEAGASASTAPDAAFMGPLVAAWAAASAELVEYLVDVHGGTDGLQEAREFGIDVSGALECAIRQWSASAQF